MAVSKIIAAIACSMLLAGCSRNGSVEEFVCEGSEPSLSADGGQLLFRDVRNGRYVVGVKNLLDGGVDWIVDGPGDAFHPVWCPDGGIVFTMGHKTQTAREAMYSNSGSGWTLWKWKGGRTEQLTKGRFKDVAAGVSPDGDVYFASGRAEDAKASFSDRLQMFVLRSGSADPERIYGTFSVRSSSVASPRISPDGRIVVWAEVEGLFKPWRLAAARVSDMSKRAFLTPPDREAYAPAWHPDGTLLAYTGAGVDEKWGIWLLDPVSGRETRLADGCEPSFAPDGKSLVYERDGRIYRRKLRAQDIPPPGPKRRPARQCATQVVSVSNPSSGTRIELPSAAAFGDGPFWLRAKVRETDMSRRSRNLVTGVYGESSRAFQLMYLAESDCPFFALRRSDGHILSLRSPVSPAVGIEHEYLCVRIGRTAYFCIDGRLVSETTFDDPVIAYGHPQELVVGGGAFAGEIAYVACGSGVPDDLPEPPSFVSLLKEEGK